MADESIENRRMTALPTTTDDRSMKNKKGKTKSLPVPSALVIMFGKPGDRHEKKMAYKSKKRKKDYEEDEDEEGEE